MKYIVLGSGEKCKNCESEMQRRKRLHSSVPNNRSYFEIYDYCSKCKKSWDYEEFRVLLEERKSLF
jgi:hypothetical protein